MGTQKWFKLVKEFQRATFTIFKVQKNLGTVPYGARTGERLSSFNGRHKIVIFCFIAEAAHKTVAM